MLVVSVQSASMAPAVRTTGLSCVDESGAAVDWWFMIKHPRYSDKKQKQNVGDGSGTGYVYVTSKDSSKWTTSMKQVTDSSCLLGKVLAPVYAKTAKNYVFYNDQLPNGSWTRDYGERARRLDSTLELTSQAHLSDLDSVMTLRLALAVVCGVVVWCGGVVWRRW